MRLLKTLLLVAFACMMVACTTVQSADITAYQPSQSTTTIPAGSRLRVALIDGVSTTKNSPGDEFEASLVDPVVVDGKTILERGTKLTGHVADVEESGRVKGRASLRLVLNSVMLHGDEIEIDTNPYVAVAGSTKTRDVAVIGGGAGTGTVLATKGKDLHYPPETRLNFTLASALQIPG